MQAARTAHSDHDLARRGELDALHVDAGEVLREWSMLDTQGKDALAVIAGMAKAAEGAIGARLRRSAVAQPKTCLMLAMNTLGSLLAVLVMWRHLSDEEKAVAASARAKSEEFIRHAAGVLDEGRAGEGTDGTWSLSEDGCLDRVCANGVGVRLRKWLPRENAEWVLMAWSATIASGSTSEAAIDAGRDAFSSIFGPDAW
jgi:hypothetical protein